MTANGEEEALQETAPQEDVEEEEEVIPCATHIVPGGVAEGQHLDKCLAGKSDICRCHLKEPGAKREQERRLPTQWREFGERRAPSCEAWRPH